MLTDTWLRKTNGKPQDKELTKADTKGMEARVRTTGAISFIYRGYLKNGTRIKMTIGKYPEMSLREARDRAEEIRLAIAEGDDPRLVRKAEIAKRMTEPTVDELYQLWYEQYASKKKKRHLEHRRTYELYVQPKLGDIKVRDLTRHAWVTHLNTIAAKVPEIASRITGDIKQMYDFGIDTGRLEAPSVVAGINRKTLGVVKKQRTRVLDDDDIRLFYQVMREKDWNPKNKVIMELLLFYGCRAGELRHTQRSWLDFEKMTWTVPPEHHKTGTKTKRPLVRPILPEMEHLWRQALVFSPSSTYVFTAMETKNKVSEKMMSPGAIQDLPLKMKEHVQAHHRNEDGTPKDWEHWTNHDLRRTARSRWAAWADWATCEKMLGHKLPGEADVYDRHHYLEQMTPAYRQWWGVLKALEAGDHKVVALADRIKKA